MDAFRRYYFRPRILHDVTNGDLSTTFMGIKSTLPIFISPAAMAKLGHPAGEVNLTKGAGECGIVQGVSGPEWSAVEWNGMESLSAPVF
jgi:L-lactate dehydrogenase (cytochrome)